MQRLKEGHKKADEVVRNPADATLVPCLPIREDEYGKEIENTGRLNVNDAPFKNKQEEEGDHLK